MIRELHLVFCSMAILILVYYLLANSIAAAPTAPIAITKKIHYSDVYRKLCLNGPCCQAVDMKYADELALSFVPLFRKQSNSLPALTNIYPPVKIQPQCEQQPKVWTGVLTNRTIVDVFLFTQELDILEFRLYELDEIVDWFVVVESAYSHRGWRKGLIFQDNSARFQRFQSKLIYLNVDLCQHYANVVAKHRRGSVSNGVVWDIQDAMRQCAAELLLPRLHTLSDDALVVLSDLDEIPSAQSVANMKYCQPHSNIQGYRAVMEYWTWFNVYSGCLREPGRPGASFPPICFTTLASVRSKGELLFRHCNHFPQVTGGTHIQQYGSQLDLDYKQLSSAEGGEFGRWLRMPGYDSCNVTDAVLAIRQQRIHHDPVYFTFRGEHRDYKTHSLPNDLSCLPWVLQTNPARFPFAWAVGSYSLYSD